MDAKQIIMNFTMPPGMDDLDVIASGIIETIPEELAEYCTDLVVQIEEVPDDALQSDLELDDPFELLALFRSGKELTPGVEKKSGAEEDRLMLFRRPILDLWCENGEDLTTLMREVIIEEIARNFDFEDDAIDEMTARHYQGML